MDEIVKKLDGMHKVPEKKPSILINFKDDPELFVILDEYRRALGWSWKRMFLMGFANTVARLGDNDDLVIRIADYLGARR